MSSWIFKKLTIEDMALKGKRVFIRVDFNVPVDENLMITDDHRIRSALPTINYCIDEGAKVIVASHLGRPKGKPDPKFSLGLVAKRLQRLLNKEVNFVPDCIGPDVTAAVEKMQNGDVLVLENLRFHAGEEENDESFAKALASNADLYLERRVRGVAPRPCLDVGITKYIPAGAAS